MTASNQIFLVMDVGTPVAAFTARRELQFYPRRRLDTFINPLVYTFWGNQDPSIMTMSATLSLVYRAPAGFGPPRHLHRQDDEIFLIEQGAIALWTPHDCRTAGPGDVVMPRRVPHIGVPMATIRFGSR